VGGVHIKGIFTHHHHHHHQIMFDELK